LNKNYSLNLLIINSKSNHFQIIENNFFQNYYYYFSYHIYGHFLNPKYNINNYNILIHTKDILLIISKHRYHLNYNCNNSILNCIFICCKYFVEIKNSFFFSLSFFFIFRKIFFFFF
jgi:hypothetical protein